MVKSKWSTSKLLLLNKKDIKEFRNYFKFASKDVLNYENVFTEYISLITNNINDKDEFIPNLYLGIYIKY